MRGENDDPCLLDGMPVPAELAGEIVVNAKALRLMVTDPVTGHLIDIGRLVQLSERTSMTSILAATNISW